MTKDADDANVLFLGTWDARLVREGSVRPFLTELIIMRLEKFDEEEGFSHYDEYLELRKAAIMSDPLWPQAMAALSVGPIEFGRFEGDRIQGIVNWPSLLEVAVKRLLKETGKETVIASFYNTDAQAKAELGCFTDASGVLYVEVI